MKPLRIAILTTDKRDHDRDYANPALGFGTAPTALLQGLATLSEVEVHVISCVHQPVISPVKLAPNIFYHSLVVSKLGWMRTLYQGCIRAVRKKLREIQPDLVHGQGTELDAGISAVFSGFPNVITIHGNMRAVAKFYRARPGSFLWGAGKLEAFALRRTDGVLGNSSYTEKCVIPCARKIWRVPNALRTVFFDRPQIAPAASLPILLNIGTTLPYKQPLKILEAAGELWRQGFKFELRFIGDRALHTEYGAVFAQQLAVAEAAGYARHLGLLDATQLIAAMEAASALVHFPTEEAFGLVVAEALARNMKLFGAATGGVPDIAAGVEGVELFPAADFPALTNAIARWLKQGCPRPQNAAQTMRDRYHPAVIARRHVEIYREVLGSK